MESHCNKLPIINPQFAEALTSARIKLRITVEVCSGISDSQKPKLLEAIDLAFLRFGNVSSPDGVLPWIRKTRREILNIFEMNMSGKNPFWPLVRNQIFATFGPEGLEGEVDL